jgi:hypothetical protein
MELAAGGSGWSAVSDRNMKENFTNLDGEDVLRRLRSVPVSSWNYKSQDRSIRHIGPMAQDLFAAFEVGESDTRINTIDIDGVNLAGVRALDERTKDLPAEVAALRSENEQLRKRLERLEALLGQLRK